MLEVKNLNSGYSDKQILFNISFTANAGEITAVIGPNGCGKSTLLKSLCGVLPVLSGEVIIDGVELKNLTPREIAQTVAYLPQNRQISDITVGRLVLHGRFPYLEYPRRYRNEDMVAAQKAMEQMQISDLQDKQLSSLSGGQQQKAYVAMALAQDTDTVLLDEPTTFLDVSHQIQVLNQARALADSGKHIITVIHDISHAMVYADRIIVLKEGTVIYRGNPEELYQSGVLDSVFNVSVKRVKTESGWLYYCEG